MEASDPQMCKKEQFRLYPLSGEKGPTALPSDLSGEQLTTAPPSMALVPVIRCISPEKTALYLPQIFVCVAFASGTWELSSYFHCY